MTATNAPRHTHGEKEFVVLMAAIMSVVAFSIDAMLPALGTIAEDLAVRDPQHAQFVISCFFIGMATGQLLCGPLSDALGRRRLLFLSLTVYLVGTVICFSAQQLHWMLIGRMIQGLGAAGPYVSTMSIVRDRFSGNAMARIMSLVMMIFIMVPVVAPSVGQLILLLASWRMIFAVFAIYALMVLVWSLLRLRETLSPNERIPFKFANLVTGVTTVLGHRATAMYLLCVGCVFGALIGYLNSCLAIFRGLFGVGDAFALYFGALALTLGIASFCNAWLVERFGMRRICQLALGFIVFISLPMLAYQWFVGPQLVVFMSYATLLFFCFGLLFGNVNALAMEPMGHIAGMASAVIGALSSVISISAGTLIGQLYNQTLFPIVLGSMVLALIALALMAAARPAQPTTSLSQSATLG